MVKKNTIDYPLSEWLGLIQNLTLKRDFFYEQIDESTKNYDLLSMEEKKDNVIYLIEIQNINEFINKINSYLIKNKSYRMIYATLHNMADIELEKSPNSSVLLKEMSEKLSEYYSEKIVIKFDKPIYEYIGY